MKTSVEQLIADIVEGFMELPKDRIWVRDKNFKIPDGDGIFVVVGLVDSQIITNANSVVPTDEGMEQQLSVTTRENVQIDIMSRSDEARTRRYEILQAIASVYSEQVQEENQFRIFTQPMSFVNASGPEGGSNISRYTTTIACHTWQLKKVMIQPYKDGGDYFDKFKTRVDDEKSIETANGIIEFEIPEA